MGRASQGRAQSQRLIPRVGESAPTNLFANRGTKLPLPTGFSRSYRPWEICINDEPFIPRHKVWTHDLIPSHRPRHIHTTTYPPLKKSLLVWYRWHFALVWRPGYSAPTTFWRDTPPKAPLPYLQGVTQSKCAWLCSLLPHPPPTLSMARGLGPQ